MHSFLFDTVREDPFVLVHRHSFSNRRAIRCFVVFRGFCGFRSTRRKFIYVPFCAKRYPKASAYRFSRAWSSTSLKRATSRVCGAKISATPATSAGASKPSPFFNARPSGHSFSAPNENAERWLPHAAARSLIVHCVSCIVHRAPTGKLSILHAAFCIVCRPGNCSFPILDAAFRDFPT